MKEKLVIMILLIFIIITLTCDKKPTEPEHLNPFDKQNTQTGGDPFKLTATIANGGVTLSWNIPPIQGLVSFRIYRSASEQTGYQLLQTVDKTKNSYVDKNIINGYIYWYRISCDNSRGIETDYTNTAAVNIKTAPALVINGGDEYTSSRIVNLTILDNTAVEMILSNYSDFSDSNWEPHSTSKEWTLITGSGEKVVYLKVKYVNANESVVVSDTIDTQPINPGIVIANDSTYTPTRNVQLTLTAMGSNIYMKVSEDSSFTGIEWQSYLGTLNFQLSTGAGTKKVYAKFKNDFEIESETVFDTILPQPMDPSITIANSAQYTLTRNVELNLSAAGSNLQMEISDDSTFTGFNWQAYSSSTDFLLSIGEGDKIVYAKFKNDFEIESQVVSDKISPQPMDPSISIADGEQYTPIRNVQVNLSAAGSNLQVKISDDSTFTGLDWQIYSSSTNFQLSTGEGDKIVYAKFKNDFEIESQVVSDIISPQPMYPNILIANGAQYTSTRNVQVNLSVAGSNLQMKISEDSIFTGLDWQIYSSSTNFLLSIGEGDKIVYAKYMNDFEIESTIVQDVIILDMTPPIPVLVVIPDSGITNETTFQFDPTSSSDNSSLLADMQIRFDWDNDGYWDTYLLPFSIINYKFTTGGGDKIVRMQLKDDAGWTADVAIPVFVNTRPVASFTATPDANNYLLFHFNASASSDYEDGTNLQYRWDWENDGNWDTDFSTSATASKLYGSTGAYSVNLQVQDSRNLTNSIIKTVNIGLVANWITIPAGEYTSGQNDEIRNISYTYQIMKYEVTNEQYKIYLEQVLEMGLITVTSSKVQGYYSGDSHFGAGIYDFYNLAGSTSGYHIGKISWNGTNFIIPIGYEDHPVIFITWFGATSFAKYYGCELPTIEEWEKAARGNSGWDYPWGDFILGNRANYVNSGDPFDNGTTPVGYYDGTNHNGFQTFNSASPFGLYDMAGNVTEWSSTVNEVFNWPYNCGGSWSDDMNTLRTWNHIGSLGVQAGFSSNNLGFRCIQR